MRLRIELPEKQVVAEAALYVQAAPTVTRLIYDALVAPLETYTSHACFDGHEVYCFLPPLDEKPPLENRTMRPQPGEIMFFHADPNEFVLMAHDRLTGGSKAFSELAFIYGEVDLRHYWEEGLHGSVVGHLDRGFDEFARACAETLVDGRTTLRVAREET